MTEPPSTSELDRRFSQMAEEQRAAFAALNARLDKFPTEQTILAYFATRDQQIGAQERRIAQLDKELEQERRDREAGDKEIEKRAADARRWAIGTAVMVAGLITAILGFVANLLGGA